MTTQTTVTNQYSGPRPGFARFVEWELTRGCNMKCAHCYNRPGTARSGELSTEEALRVCGFLSAKGCESVSLSGGEPTLRADWPRIAASLTGQGIRVQLLSNGLHFGPTQADAARSSGVSTVLLSLDGMESTHDLVRRRPGSFRSVLASVDALHRAGVSFGFITTVLVPNVRELDLMAELTAELGARLWSVWLGIPRHRSDLWLNPGDAIGIVDRLLDLKDRCPALTVGDNLALFPGSEPLHHRRDCALCTHRTAGAGENVFPFSGCEAGREALGLESDGTVTGCLALPDRCSVGNLRHSSFEDLWRLAAASRQRRVKRLAPVCRACRHVASCQGGCHATALTFSDVLDNPYCPWKKQVPRYARARATVASVAASVMMAAGWAGGCATPTPTRSAEPQPPPPPARVNAPAPASGARVAPSRPPARKTSPAYRAAHSGKTGANKTVRVRAFPRCCMMHVLRPGCRCGGPVLTPKKP